MKKLIVGLALSIMAAAGVAQAHVKHLSNVTYISAYDGDTFTVDIPGVPEVFGYHIPVRIRGIDTPEIRGRCSEERYLAIRARNWVREKLAGAHKIILIEPERDKYFRLLASVEVDGQDLAIALMERGYAIRYDGKTKKAPWCDYTND